MMSNEEPVCGIGLKDMIWEYRGEGNANLVISLIEAKVILRFEKCDYGLKNDEELAAAREKKMKKQVLFYKNIIVPFLGKVYIQPPNIGLMSIDEVKKLDLQLLSQRPDYRLSKGICFPLVTIHPDYTYLPPILGPRNQKIDVIPKEELASEITYCVEIKPKQGWIFPGDRWHPKCTYCLNQYLKLKKKRVGRISEYCPLDLFSGDRMRMKKAMKSLLITPQNNLKIFKNGKLVYSDDCKGNHIEILKDWLEPHKSEKEVDTNRIMEKWSELLTEALLRELTLEPAFNVIPSENYENMKNGLEPSPLAGLISPCNWTKESLPEASVLNRILTMQKLQNRPFSVLYNMYCEKKMIEGDYDYVDKLLQADEPPGPVERYLLSTTAKDCSIFVSFKRTELIKNNLLHYIQDCDGESFYINIGMSDIDPKPLACIEKHYKRDKDVVETVKQYIDGGALFSRHSSSKQENNELPFNDRGPIFKKIIY